MLVHISAGWRAHQWRRLFAAASVIAAAFIISPQAAHAAPVVSHQSPGLSMAKQAVAAVQAANDRVGVSVTGAPAETPVLETSATGVLTASSPAGRVGVSLPGSPTTNVEHVAGSSVSRTGSAVETTVTPGVGTTQVAQELLSASAPRTFSYVISLPNGYRMAPQVNGAIALTAAAPGEALTESNTMGWIAPAWAVDASGIPVPTSYTVVGDVLTQSVSPTASISYPVIADPTVTFGWLIYVHFYHSEVGEVVWTAFFAGATAALQVACNVLPTPVNAMCIALVAVLGAVVITIFQTAYNRGGGVVLEFTYGGTPVGYMYVGDNWT